MKANQYEALLWKIAVLGTKNPPVSAGIFSPSPMLVLVFYIPPCRKCLPAWRNVKNQHPVLSGQVAESCIRFCYSVFIYFLYLSHTEVEDGTDVDDQEKGADYAKCQH
jgi:hypothetical protein